MARVMLPIDAERANEIELEAWSMADRLGYRMAVHAPGAGMPFYFSGETTLEDGWYEGQLRAHDL